jgi:hypothetical protein
MFAQFLSKLGHSRDDHKVHDSSYLDQFFTTALTQLIKRASLRNIKFGLSRRINITLVVFSFSSSNEEPATLLLKWSHERISEPFAQRSPF